ncbi:MAG: hypothetical protein CMN30_30910 [Sandaracinus sp.]|nr:hypothetical protein [Sandaracinus sp.]
MLLDDEEPHSARVLGDWRDEWWAGDYLRLIAARLELGSHHRALDLGTGLGHWARTVLPLLAEDATMVCIDREPTWTESAAPHERMERATGDVTALPFADESFDLVTGQTILMHVPDARVAVREALRVLRPGGLALFAEPSNLANCLLRDSVSAGYAPARLARMAQLFTHVAEGRRRLGEGDECVADVLPAYLLEAGFGGIGASQNERLAPTLPPYTEAMRQAFGPMPELVRERRWLYDRAYALRLYGAGDGPAEAFDRLHEELVEHGEAWIAAVAAGTYWSLGGHNHVLVHARRQRS